MPGVQVERDEVELPIVAQLTAMGWTHLPGKQVGTLSFDAPLLTDRLGAALRRINLRQSDDEPWMDATDVRRTIDELASVPLGEGVAKANSAATDLLLSGHVLTGPSSGHGGSSATVQFVEWHEEHHDRNDFVVVDQLRVRNRSGQTSVLDLVLFVNGIPLVAVECKSPHLTDPLYSAVADLRHYAGDPLPDDERAESGIPLPAGVPELFRTVQLLVAATGETAYLGSITSGLKDFRPWRSVEPETKATLVSEVPDLAGDLNERHKLVGVVLRPAALLRIVRHYVIAMPVETESGGFRRVKVVARHQQYRAAEKAVRRLLNGRTRRGPETEDERGGLIWHTQGSGKSLTMAFLVRRMHLHHRLGRHTVVVVTDRAQLQKQLARTLKLSESDVETARNAAQMEGLLRDGGRRVVFAMIQKYGAGGFTFADDAEEDGDDRDLAGEYREAERARRERRAAKLPPVPNFPECTTSPDVVVLVDEAHRSHTSLLHAALRKALPNAAKIGFTGTPIMTGKAEDTRRIFNGGVDRDFLDTYRMAEAERDKVVVRVRYEGRTGEGKVFDRDGLDMRFEDLVADRTPEQRRALTKRWPTARDVAESRPMIRAKAADMLEHWVTTVLASGGFKAQVAAVSRKAAVEYHHALRAAQEELLTELADFRPEALVGIAAQDLSRRQRYLLAAHRFRALLRRIDFVPVISAGSEQKRREWLEWTTTARQEAYIGRFHLAFPQPGTESEWVDPAPLRPEPESADHGVARDNPWSQAGGGQGPGRAETLPPDPVHPDSPIAFLIVKSMLLTGFDAPREQVLYLDRPIRDAELLQAVARVNRPARGKDVGYVVDYHGVFDHLADALAAYAKEDVDDTMQDMATEIGALAPAAEEVRRRLEDAGVADEELSDFTAVRRAALALDDEETRRDFDEALHAFLATLERVLPHEAGLDFVAQARRWGLLQKRIRTLYRDSAGGSFSLRNHGRKVRALIAAHLEGPEIDQVIAPVSLAEPDFDKRVAAMPRKEAAAEMEHALRFHLEERTKREDPERYSRLSDRLEELLREHPERFEQQVAEFGALIDEARRNTEEDPYLTSLSPLEQRVYRLLDRELEGSTGVERRTGDIRPLVKAVCVTATRLMSKVSYQGRHQDVTELADHIQHELLDGGLSPTTSDWTPLTGVAQRLAAYAAQNRGSFLARSRGE